MSKSTKTKLTIPSKDLLDQMDAFFEKYKKGFFWFGMAFAFLFSLLLFSLKMSEMGDDSGYILRAMKLLKYGDFPAFQGSFYPFFIAPFMAVFGVKIVLFKFLSLLMILGALYFFYQALKGKIPYSLLMPVFLLTAINSYILYFSSQTFSEALYLLLQTLLFYVLFRNEDVSGKDFNWKADWKHFLLIGLILFVGGLTRSVHLGAVIALVFFFLIIGRWRSSLATVGSYGIFFLLFEGIKRIFWHSNLAQIAAQGAQMKLKNPYNAQEGLEPFSGYIDRLVDNSIYYISNAFYSMTGLRSEQGDGNGFVTLLTYGIVLLAVVLVFRKNRILLFNTLYIGVLCLVTFIVLQVFWAQWRLIGVFYPFLLLAVFSAFYYGLKRFKSIQFLYPLLLVILLFTGLGDTFKKTGKNWPVIQKNLAGDTFADYAPEWKSFMEMSQWSSKNVPTDVAIASRKPEMSFIYTGREFYGIYSFPEVNLDSIRGKIRPDLVAFGIDPMRLMSLPLFSTFSKDVLCFVQGADNSFVGVYQMDAAKAGALIPQLKAVNLTVDLQIMQTLQSKAQSGLEMHVTDPEKLVFQLQKNNVRFIILNSQYLFQTIHRYLTFIQLKYPQSLSTVHSIGQSPTEAMLIQFHPENL
jgi:hypothetical protein